MTTVGLIRVLATSDSKLLNAHGRALEAEYGFSVISRCIPDQPSGVHSAATHALSVPKVEALARELSGEVDAIIVSCAAVILLAYTGMTSIGVAAELRQRFRLPVVDAVLAAGAAVVQLSKSLPIEGR